jgi:hypothetical protein
MRFSFDVELCFLILYYAAPHSVEWSQCKYMVFDTPHPSLQSKPYLERYGFLELLFAKTSISTLPAISLS